MAIGMIVQGHCTLVVAPLIVPRRTPLTSSIRVAGRGADHPGRGLAIDRGAEHVPLTALVTPFRPARSGFGAARPAALVFIKDPEAPNLSTLLLQDLFRLTPAQAAIAQALAAGQSLNQSAESLAISHHTARAHLQAVFAKTRTTPSRNWRRFCCGRPRGWIRQNHRLRLYPS